MAPTYAAKGAAGARAALALLLMLLTPLLSASALAVTPVARCVGDLNSRNTNQKNAEFVALDVSQGSNILIALTKGTERLPSKWDQIENSQRQNKGGAFKRIGNGGGDEGFVQHINFWKELRKKYSAKKQLVRRIRAPLQSDLVNISRIPYISNYTRNMDTTISKLSGRYKEASPDSEFNVNIGNSRRSSKSSSKDNFQNMTTIQTKSLTELRQIQPALKKVGNTTQFVFNNTNNMIDVGNNLSKSAKSVSVSENGNQFEKSAEVIKLSNFSNVSYSSNASNNDVSVVNSEVFLLNVSKKSTPSIISSSTTKIDVDGQKNRNFNSSRLDLKILVNNGNESVFIKYGELFNIVCSKKSTSIDQRSHNNSIALETNYICNFVIITVNMIV